MEKIESIDTLYIRYNIPEDMQKLITLMARHRLLHLLSKEYIEANEEFLNKFRKHLVFYPNSEDSRAIYTLRNEDNYSLQQLIKDIVNKIPKEFTNRLNMTEEAQEKFHSLVESIIIYDGVFDYERFKNNIIDYYNSDDEYKKNLSNLISQAGITLYYKERDDNRDVL